MTRDEKIQAFAMRIDGYTLEEIADKFGVTREWIRQMLYKSVSCDNYRRKYVYPEITKWMFENNINQKDICEMTGYKQNAVSYILIGRNQPSLKFISAICDAMQMQPSVAFKREDVKDENI